MDSGHAAEAPLPANRRYPTCDANGIFVQDFIYAPAGQVKAVHYLDVGGHA